jgi:GT2 family glycosyltransferase
MVSHPTVAVIVVNWNRPQDTLECLESVWSSTYAQCGIIVVDNGSTDDSVERLRNTNRPLILLENVENLGFSGGNNRGMQYALERGADYVLLLNNDTVIATDAIERLVLAAEANPTLGILCPKILFFDPPPRIWFGGSKFNPRYLTSHMVGYGLEDMGQFNGERDIPFISGCAMFIRRELIEKAGLLCEDFFAVMEDLDYSLRASQYGYRLRYVPAAVVRHKESISSGGRDAPQYVYYRTRNVSILRRRWANGSLHGLISASYMLLYFMKHALRLAREGKWRSILGLIYGIRDGILGRRGRREYRVLASSR